MAAVELHVATCARCQAIVGVTARSAPAAPVAEAPAGFSLWKWWLAPIAAGAAAITLWMVVPQETMQAPAAPGAGDRGQKDAPRPQAKERQAAAQPAPPAAPPADNQLAAASRQPGRRAALRVRGSPGSPRRIARAQTRESRRRSSGRRRRRSAAAPARPVEVPGPAAAREATLQKATGASATLEIVSPDPRRRWRVNPEPRSNAAKTPARHGSLCTR